MNNNNSSSQNYNDNVQLVEGESCSENDDASGSGSNFTNTSIKMGKSSRRGSELSISQLALKANNRGRVNTVQSQLKSSNESRDILLSNNNSNSYKSNEL
jgi:hypothetical protein